MGVLYRSASTGAARWMGVLYRYSLYRWVRWMGVLYPTTWVRSMGGFGQWVSCIGGIGGSAGWMGVLYHRSTTELRHSSAGA